MGMRRSLGALLLVAATPAWAHGTGSPAAPPHWSFELWVVLPLLIAAALFGFGWLRLRARSSHGVSMLTRRALFFASGWLILSGAVISPLHDAGGRSFAAHMFEHELLMLAAAPLLVLAKPLAVMLWAFPGSARRAIGLVVSGRTFSSIWHRLRDPITATLLQATALWLWHAPALFDRALASEGWHAVQHLSFLLGALLFWNAMFARSTPRGLAVLCLFATSVVSGALGALMAFSASPWYARYAAMGMAPFGLSPLEDQQLAGLLMWVPGGLVHAAAALALLHAMLREPGERAHAL